MQCKVLRDFSMGGRSFKQDEVIEIPDDSVIRLSAVVAPVEAISEKPPKDKAIKPKQITKKGVKKLK